MDDQPFPLPRATRETEILAGDGGATYGPFDFRIFDTADVRAYVKHEDVDDFTAAAFTVQKVASREFDDFTLTFDEPLPATSRYIVQASRLHERQVAVTKGGAISGLALEKELSKQGSVIEELRRDINRGGSAVPGQSGQTLVFAEDGNVRPGADQSDIEHAQEYAADARHARDAAEAEADRAEAARDAALGAVPNVFVSTRTALAALNTNTITAAFLKEPGREGQFFWRSGDYSSLVAIDTAEGVYIKADAVSASTGAWVRVFDGFTYDIMWFGAVVYSSVSGDMNANVTALSIIHALAQSRATVILPFGLLNINQTIEITKPISFIGKTKLGSGFYAVGFNQDTSILDYQGTAIAPIQNIELRDFGLWSDNNLARGMTLTWVNKSTFDNLYLYDLYRGVYGDYAWSDSWKNISTYNITRETFLFGDECNNSNFDRVEFSGSSGLKITGHCAGFAFTGCDFENITDENGAALELVPTSGKFISGVSLFGCYFERIKGVGIRCSGADARSVRGLSVQGCSIYGGSTDFFSGAAGQAEYGIAMHNVSGFMITANTFDDWRSACIARDDTERDGRVENNTISRTPDLTNTAGSIHGSVINRNNFSTTAGVYSGRREEWANSVPTSGTYRAGDVVWVRGAPTIDVNGLVLLGWARMTSGSGHDVGTDWARLYASHVSPAA